MIFRKWIRNQRRVTKLKKKYTSSPDNERIETNENKLKRSMMMLRVSSQMNKEYLS